MGVFRNPLDLYKAQKARFERLNNDARKGHRDMAEQGVRDFGDLTRGKISTAQLRKMGHPYSRKPISVKAKLARRAVPPLPINRQTGKLRSGVFLRTGTEGAQSFDVGSSAPHEPYILSPTGTKRMIARGFWQVIKKRWLARNKAFFDQFVRNQRS